MKAYVDSKSFLFLMLSLGKAFLNNRVFFKYLYLYISSLSSRGCANCSKLCKAFRNLGNITQALPKNTPYQVPVIPKLEIGLGYLGKKF